VKRTPRDADQRLDHSRALDALQADDVRRRREGVADVPDVIERSRQRAGIPLARDFV